MGVLVYARASENVAPSAIVTIDNGTESTDFPIAGAAPAPIADLNPAKEKSFTGVTGGIVYDFGSAQQLDGLAIIHHNLKVSLANVQIQGNATDTWGGPTLDVNMPIPTTVHADGFFINPWLDLTGEGSRTFQFWRLNFGTANDVAIKLGQVLLLSNLRKVAKNFEIQALDEEEHRIIELETDFGITGVFDYGVKRRQLIGRIVASNTEADEWLESQRDVRGRSRGWFLARDRDVNDAMFVRWVNPAGYGRILRSHGIHYVPFAVQEISRGLVL